MEDPGEVYAMIKEVRVGNEIFKVTVEGGGVLVKIGRSKDERTRNNEANSESSTWHPESIRTICVKRVPSMRKAEDKLHCFFQENNVKPAYPRGGVEWFVISNIDRVVAVFEALETDTKEPYKHTAPQISTDTLRAFLKTCSVETYDSIRPVGFPSIQDIRDGYFGMDCTDISMLVPVTRR